MSIEWLREFKRECLLDEHRALSSFVEKEIVMTTATKLVAIAAWLGAAGSRSLPAIAVAVLALWSVDVLYAYYGDVYKRRRLQVRAWLDALPHATEAELGSWKSPANPFDGLSRSEKIAALTGTIGSPAVSGVYGALLVVAVLFGAL
ncbi:MAG: hypothetical protein ABR587_09690 [Candidatus Binatia bacterium]